MVPGPAPGCHSRRARRAAIAGRTRIARGGVHDRPGPAGAASGLPGPDVTGPDRGALRAIAPSRTGSDRLHRGRGSSKCMPPRGYPGRHHRRAPRPAMHPARSPDAHH